MDLSTRATASLTRAVRLLIAALLLISPTLAETRSALVVGNDVYTAFTPLKNAKNDARAMAKELEKLGFTVTLSEDASSAQLETTIKNWTAGLRDTDVAMFFYAGHGVQVEGTNYLVPIDFDGDEIDIKHACLNADMIRERMEKSGPDTNIIVLDACRNNPFSNSRGGSRGLQFMEGNVGTLIAFATSPGGISNDNPDGQNGLFTKHLLANLSSPGLDALQVFQNVGRGVYAESGGKQKPWISASVMPRAFQFVRGPATGSTAPLPTPPVESPAQVTVIDTPPEVAVSNTAVTDNRGNVGRVPKPNIVLLLVAEDASSAAWLLELARDRIYKWYGGDPSGTDITLHVEYMSFSDAKARSMLEKKFRIKRDDLPAMLSAVKVNSNFEGSLAMQRRVKESTDLGPFFNTLFQPKAP